MVIQSQWARAIDQYLVAQRAAGKRRSTLDSERQRISQMASRIGVGPWEVTAEQLVTWAGSQDWLTETRRGRYSAYRSFWGWAVATERTSSNPTTGLAKVKPGAPNPNPVPERVYRKAMLRSTDRERIWLELAHDHGLRRCEVAVIHSDDIFEDILGHSLVVHGKGGKARHVPLTTSTARQLLDLDAGWAFPGSDHGHLSPSWIGKRVAQLLDGAWTMHKLRHAAGTNFYLHGDLAIAQKLLGHASPATTMIYVKLPDSRLRATVTSAAS